MSVSCGGIGNKSGGEWADTLQLQVTPVGTSSQVAQQASAVTYAQQTYVTVVKYVNRQSNHAFDGLVRVFG